MTRVLCTASYNHQSSVGTLAGLYHSSRTQNLQYSKISHFKQVEASSVRLHVTHIMNQKRKETALCTFDLENDFGELPGSSCS